MKVGVLLISLYFPEVQTIKERRSLIHKIKDRTIARFKLSTAELIDDDDRDLSSGKLAVAVVGGDQAVLDRLLHDVVSFVEGTCLCRITGAHREFLSYNASEFLPGAPEQHKRWREQ